MPKCTRTLKLLPPRHGPWGSVETVLQQNFFEPDLQAARALYAAVAAHDLQGQPVWPMLVGPPGSMKTVLVEALRDLPKVHLIDKITPNTFISGQIQDTKPSCDPSLLCRIGRDGILVYPDFGTLLSMRREDRASVLADMRRIYDGRLRKEFGTSGKRREWSGRITFVVAATPDVDRHYAIFQSLGERFVMIRLHRPGGDEAGEKAGLCAMKQDLTQVRTDLEKAVFALFQGLRHQRDAWITERRQKQIAALAEFTVRARTHVARDRFGGKAITHMPEAEAPTRLSQQLCQLAKGSARLSRRTVVTETDMALVRRVAFDCIPAIRRRILDGFIHGDDSAVSRIPKATLSYAREELQVMDLLTESGLSGVAQGLLARAGSSQNVPLKE